MADPTAWIGREARATDMVTAGAVARFRATIDRPGDGPAAPPGFHWSLCLPDTPTDALGEDGHPLKGGFLPPIDLPRRMWAGSEVRFLRPIAIGAAIERVSTIAAIREKQGSSGPLAFVEIDHLTRADGADAVSERQTIVYRAASTEPMPLPATGGAELNGWDRQRTLTPGAALLQRYSALTFNSHRIHYDLPYATGVEGYPGLVVHGPLIATLLLDLVAQHIGPDAIGGLSFRALAPAIAGQALHLLARADGDAIELAAQRDDGSVAMRARVAIRRNG
ncbi:FAS1-like dehydratase domain-containing protein [Sphingomonas alpina]|uniref:MaoC family dehydratase N-terminal domain-containing protein n=1 Tax=Sphingomonas alpina TaxID=653931 RepID=A0A7H0LM90_9SPHN|nr:MaoC family dehydratase N-terminal domain-containing protein [Sphingomonas alpina]QNQ10793.1 MaoC family dehydratase N-terminal domain-containing protein [Sphingomonas alpina]